MSTMVERVARALQQEIAPYDPYDELIEEGRRAWNAHARVVIAAMREPTKAMEMAGAEVHKYYMTDAYRAMIDVALEDK